MTELSDFLGHILEELTRARIQADKEAIRTARMYASESEGLLKNFAIPRMRLPNIEVTAPVIVSAVPDGYVEKTDAKLLAQAILRDIKDILTQKKITINTNDITKLIKEDEFLSNGHIKESSAELLSIKVGEQLKAAETKPAIPADVHKQVVALVREQLGKTFSQLPKKPLGISIDPRTSAIKEFTQTAGQNNANALVLKMSITEDALVMDFYEPSEKPPSEPQKDKPVIKRLSPE